MAKQCLCSADLRNRLTVEKNTPTTNTDGQKVESWKPVFKVWANVTSRGGMERRVYEQLRAECDYAVRIIWSNQAAAIKPADYRFIHDGKTLNIAVISDPTGEKDELMAHCTEYVV